MNVSKLYRCNLCAIIYDEFHYVGILRACETLRSAREIASVALSAERERYTENVFHIVKESSTWNEFDHTEIELTCSRCVQLGKAGSLPR